MVRRFEQENAAQCSGILTAATQRNYEYDRFKMAAANLSAQRPIGRLPILCLCCRPVEIAVLTDASIGEKALAGVTMLSFI